MQVIEEKVDMSQALDASLVYKESSGTESKEQDTSRRSGNDAHADDADIRPIYDEELMERELVVAKPHHMIASSNSRNSSKNMPRFNLNDMVHNHYLEEAKKKTQESSRNSEPSKCVFNENHDHFVTKFLNEINSHAKVPSNKTTNRNKLVEQTSFAKKPKRQIPKGHRFSIKKTSVVHEKTMTPRSCLRWKLMGKIFKTVSLRWVLTEKIFTSSTTKVDSEPTNGSNVDITNQYECKQTLDVSTCTLNLCAEFRDTLIQHTDSVKKSIDERAHHKQEYDRRVNERLMQIIEEKVDMSQALDDSLVYKESSGTESKEQDTSRRSGNDAHADDADIRPIYDEELIAEHFKTTVCSQVDVNNDLSKPVTAHYLPKERELVVAKPYHMIASSNSRNSSKNMLRFNSNDMVHNHYLEEAKKKTQESSRNSEPSVMPSATS
nr:hypothetical protein [Tanacetum cinerariifolium]